MNLLATWGETRVATEIEILEFSTPKSPKNAFSGILKYLFIYLLTLFEFGVNPSSCLHKETWLIEAK